MICFQWKDINEMIVREDIEIGLQSFGKYLGFGIFLDHEQNHQHSYFSSN